jgi:hypothetical protein
MADLREVIWPKGKAVARFNSEGELVVGTYFALDDQPHEIFPRRSKKTQGKEPRKTQGEIIEQAKKTLGHRRIFLGWGSRSLEITAGVILGKTITDVVRSPGQDSLKEVGIAIGKLTVASVAEIGSVWLRERQRSIDRKITQVEKLATSIPPEPKPQS